MTNANKDLDFKRYLIISLDRKIVCLFFFLRNALVSNTKWASRDQLLTAVHKSIEKLFSSITIVIKYNRTSHKIKKNKN